jgi:hypothetical protein
MKDEKYCFLVVKTNCMSCLFKMTFCTFIKKSSENVLVSWDYLHCIKNTVMNCPELTYAVLK